MRKSYRQSFLLVTLTAGIASCTAEKKPESLGPKFCGDSGCAQAESNRKFEAEGVKNEGSFKTPTDIALKPIQCSTPDGTYLVQNHNLFSQRQGFEGSILHAYDLSLSANQEKPKDLDPQAKCQYNVGDATHTRAIIVYDNVLAVYAEQSLLDSNSKPVYYDMSGPLGVTSSYFQSELKKDARAPAESLSITE